MPAQGDALSSTATATTACGCVYSTCAVRTRIGPGAGIIESEMPIAATAAALNPVRVYSAIATCTACAAVSADQSCEAPRRPRRSRRRPSAIKSCRDVADHAGSTASKCSASCLPSSSRSVSVHAWPGSSGRSNNDTCPCTAALRANAVAMRCACSRTTGADTPRSAMTETTSMSPSIDGAGMRRHQTGPGRHHALIRSRPVDNSSVADRVEPRSRRHRQLARRLDVKHSRPADLAGERRAQHESHSLHAERELLDQAQGVLIGPCICPSLARDRPGLDLGRQGGEPRSSASACPRDHAAAARCTTAGALASNPRAASAASSTDMPSAASIRGRRSSSAAVPASASKSQAPNGDAM